MRIIEYKIPTQIFVKAEITKLSPLPITNNSDNYYMIIPTVTSILPDNIMFIQETMLVAPCTTSNYIPKLVKLGVSLSQSMATALPKGIELKLLVIDNIPNQLHITDISSIKNSNKNVQQMVVPMNSERIVSNINNDNVLMSDGVKVHADNTQRGLLNAIDNALLKNEGYTNTNTYAPAQNNSAEPIINEIELIEAQSSNNVNNSIIVENNMNSPIKRGRGRPRKNPMTEVAKEAQSEFQNILLEKRN